MAFNTALLTDYSWSDIKLAAKHAMMSAAIGGDTLSISGRAIGRISIDDARKLYELATQMEGDESTVADGGIALVRYGERL